MRLDSGRGHGVGSSDLKAWLPDTRALTKAFLSKITMSELIPFKFGMARQIHVRKLLRDWSLLMPGTGAEGI